MSCDKFEKGVVFSAMWPLYIKSSQIKDARSDLGLKTLKEVKENTEKNSTTVKTQNWILSQWDVKFLKCTGEN